MLWLIAICIVLSIACSLVLVPVVRQSAIVTGMVDRPDQQRKLQTRPIALGGGIAVFASIVVTFGGALLIDRQFFGQQLGVLSGQWYVLFGAAFAILAVGLVDDAWGLRGRQKLLLQCLIIAALIGGGTVIERLNLFGIEIELGVFAFPATVLWLIVAVNALNLIDGADGMATTAGMIICIGLGFLSLGSGSVLSAVVGFALAGSLLGFLAYNRPPASIYLGDAGSMMVGLFVGVLAIWSNFKESTVLASAPIAILAIPLFDSTAAILRRWLTGRSIYVTDRGHLHHLLQEKYGHKKMLWFVAGLCGLTTAMSVMSYQLEMPFLAGLGVLAVFSLLVLTRSFGHAETRLLVGRAVHFVYSFAMPVHKCETEKQQRRVPLQGSGEWETVWEPLVEFAKAAELAKVKIDVNMAWLHEGYHANWQSVRLPEKASQMTVCIPLFATRMGSETPQSIGRLEVVVHAADSSAFEKMAELSDQLADLFPEIERIVANLESQKLAGKSASGRGTPAASSEPVSEPIQAKLSEAR